MSRISGRNSLAERINKCGAAIIIILSLNLSNNFPFLVGAAIDQSVRLLGGDDSREGMVEVAFNGRWGVICDNDLSAIDAQSICRGLGYGTDEAEVVPATSSK